jgi:transglutaminase-like putative cysteine protease
MSSLRHPPTAVSIPLALQRYFEIALYLLVLTGFGTLASTGGLDTPTALFVSGALLFRGYLLANRRTLLIPERWTNTLTLAYVAFYLTDYFLISGAFLSSTVHLVLFVMVVRLFSAQRDRDYYFLAVISFLMVLAAAVLTVGSTFLFAFAGFMLMAVGTFILMEMRRTSAKATVQSNAAVDSLTYRRMAWSLAGASPVLVVFILLGAAVIFFVLPRVSRGYLTSNAQYNQLTTGFSDRVQLGGIGEIQQSNALVMHIQIDDDTNGGYDLYWRGVTLNVFDGRAWSNPHEQHILPSLPGGNFALSGRDPGGPAANRTIHYRVLMEPIGSNVLFLAPRPTALEGNYRMVSMDGGDAVYNLDVEHPLNGYGATSNIARPMAAELRVQSETYPPEILLNYLQLPRLDPRIPQLAEQVSASAGNNYDKAVAIESYLRTKFGYTLQLPRPVPRDPLANFLFERKQGHCEYFASSMAVMLRTLRIPARVVNGFRTGEFNDLTSQYVIRGRDAHSWVEAYFPGYGWVSFDPTPVGPLVVHNQWNRVMLYVDAMSSFWREWVINYDASHQYRLGRETTRNSVAWVHHMQNWAHRHYEAALAIARRVKQTVTDSPARWSMGTVIAGVILVLAANARRLWRMLRRRQLASRPAKSPRAAATIWYERMLRTIARRGWHKRPAQTPAEFAASIQDESVRQRVSAFTRHYEQARFGDSAEAAGQLPELYEEISASADR